MTLKREPCKSCQLRPGNRPRGLCNRCYMNLTIRESMPTIPQNFEVSPVPVTGPFPEPAYPTSAYPGTPEKIAILEARAMAGELLWHPLDAGMITAGETFIELERLAS
jgi:hypothetical protein